MSGPNRSIYDLELSDEEVTAILDKLDAEETQVRVSERRSLRRFLRGTALVVRMSLPGFTMADFRVRLRNISQHGLAFLSRYTLEPGTRLTLQLPIGSDLSMVEKPAVVVRSRLVEGLIHEVGVEFEE